MARFAFIPTPLSGLTLVERRSIEDARGFFERLYCGDEFRATGFGEQIVQINHTLTRQLGVVRGMHFQRPPHSEVKIVSCLSGEVFDVAIDLRMNSPTFLHWHGEVLSETNHRSLLIPKGCAHGFQALSDDCELIYLHSAPYSAGAEGAVSALDPRIGISWPKPIVAMSERDRSHPFLSEGFAGLEV